MPPLAANDGLQGGELRFEGLDTLQELIASFWCLGFVRCPPAGDANAATQVHPPLLFGGLNGS